MYEPVVTTYSNAAPMPRAEVLFTSLAAGAATLTVYRRAEGREYVMRGGLKSVTTGAFTRIDFEIPFGIPVTYFAEMFNAAGLSLGQTGQTTVTLYCDDMWMHNPLDPFGGVRVDFREAATRNLSRPVSGDVFYPEGSTVGKVIAGRRRGLQGTVLDVITDTVEDADKVRDLLGTYSRVTVPVVCFRIASNHQVRIPKPFFAAVMDVAEQDMNYVLGGDQIAHEMKGDEVSPPSPGLFIPLLTRADLNAWYSTRAALNADNPTRLDANRKYSVAGTAS